ncbi:hypothetical protein BTUL_0261g00130 [Botrytis tulipae]|uniref:Heterokaryon incompatibility domain-containing protein n=1 Tax=Botrytis tulipae TaxID=87230 RepID=A0A4Z1E6E1_9HELO|nr:hypothetical protein BTUL_0261g00130 [Botrytis tulipae]
MEDIQQYQYTPLLEPDAFRIIVIHPALSIESPLSCSLIHSTLFHYNQPLIDNYSALSYVWGDANNRRTISVDEKPLLVTASLDSALRHLRDNKNVMIWADGICINQFDSEEKNRQVGLMSVIYEVASHTIIFLGETTSETDKMFKSSLRPISSSLTKQIKPGLLSNVRASHNTDTFDLESKEEIESKVHDLIRHVLDMPWFRRIWILQKLVLSRDPWVQVGAHRLKWKDFKSLIFESNSKHDSAWAKSPNYDVLDEMCTLRDSFVSRTSESSDPCHYLLKILHSRRGYGVSDPRDMLYGHLAMFANHTKSKDPKIEKFIEIDYRKTIAEVYTDLALYFLNRQLSFEFLSHVEDVDFEERKWNLPTWVPDWTSNKVSIEAKSRLQKMGRLEVIHGMRDIHVVLGKKAVLGCIGTRVNCVEMVKNEIPRREVVFALCHKIKNLHAMGGSRENEYFDDRKMFVRLVCEYFCAWFNTSETSPYNFISNDLEKLFDDRRYSHAAMEFHKRLGRISADWNPTNLGPVDNYLEVMYYDEHPKSLWIYILMAMTDVSGNFFGGKKLAVLRNKEIALVSMWTEVGYEIWRFDGKEEGPCYVFRGYDDDEGTGRIEKKEIEEENDGRAELDRTFEAFFREKKKQVMERYVECRDDGRIVWNKKILEINVILSFTGDSAHKTMRNSLMRAARVLAKLESEVNDDGKRKREKELKENLKRKMEMVVGNVLQEMRDEPRDRFHTGIHGQSHEIRDTDVMLLKTDVDGIGMERGTVKHVRFVGECVFDVESMPCESNDGHEYCRMTRKEDNRSEKKCQEVEEEMKKWWKLGLGIPSEILDNEGGYDKGEYDEGYKGSGYDLEEWEPELKDLKVTSSKEFSSKESQGREKRYLEAKRWERLVQPLQHEILAIH